MGADNFVEACCRESRPGISQRRRNEHDRANIHRFEFDSSRTVDNNGGCFWINDDHAGSADNDHHTSNDHDDDPAPADDDNYTARSYDNNNYDNGSSVVPSRNSLSVALPVAGRGAC